MPEDRQPTGQKRKRPSPTGPTKAGASNISAAQARKRTKVRDARQIAVQTSDDAFKHGQLDVDKYVKARQFEIKALESSMRGSRQAHATRAHQALPRDMRRRTASHNVKRVPKKLRARAEKEMVEDKTPTGAARQKNSQTTRSRLRLETAKRLDVLAKRSKAKRRALKRQLRDGLEEPPAVDARRARPKTRTKVKAPPGKLSTAPKPPSRFRKRQIDKTWLPTHMFHAKRARMTPPKKPLWRFAIPLTPTEKCYRPTHRASSAAGAVAWDMSYMATISLEGRQDGLLNVLGLLGAAANSSAQGALGIFSAPCISGKRTWEGWLYTKNGWPEHPIAPVTIIWCASDDDLAGPTDVIVKNTTPPKKRQLSLKRRRALVRVHPSAFFQLWNEILAAAKSQNPRVAVEDLRFEVGSIEITGPAATEALVAVLRTTAGEKGSPETTWNLLGGLSNPASLPINSLLGFSVSDPRLRFPPRPLSVGTTAEDDEQLIQVISTWSPDQTQKGPALFDRKARLEACQRMPSQRAINRRKGLAPAGEYPDAVESDPQIPVLLFASRPSTSSQGMWTLMLPWKCVMPIWYSIIRYPISSGSKVRFGGLQEKRQLAFEAGSPWFPGDFPGTMAGWTWELAERQAREKQWRKRPERMRIAWESVDLGHSKKGELGIGWTADWEYLGKIHPSEATASSPRSDGKDKDTSSEPTQDTDKPPEAQNSSSLQPFGHLLSSVGSRILENPTSSLEALKKPSIARSLVTVKISTLGRGHPKPCARIYRLPRANIELRQRWLGLIPTRRGPPVHPKKAIPLSGPTKDVTTPGEHQRDLAALTAKGVSTREGPPQAGDVDYPIVPGEEDLIGFLTTADFSLGEGRGMGLGCILLSQVLDEELVDNAHVCIVRESGMRLGRLASWEMV
ncbi:MAG: hypothetical protein M1825_002567 [Sarcosagium campestre]|nr:MAG: hypothetical protein M1825_002567 [Sarcosagium campestre]